MDLEKFKSLKTLDLDEKTKKMIKLTLIIIVVLISFLLLVSIVKKGSAKLSDKQLKNTVLRASKSYIADHKDEVNDVYGVIELTDSKLSDGGYMKPMTKLKGKNTSCKATAYVHHNDKNFSYNVKLTNCDSEYDDKTLAEVITDSSKVVTEGAGLYFDEANNEFYFKGEYVDNYVTFAGVTWRILGVDNNGNVKLLQEQGTIKSKWDDRHNTESKYENKMGINSFEGIANSRIKDALINEYNTNSMYSETVKSVIVPTSYCIGKRKENDTDKTNAGECKVKSELMPIGALTVSDFLKVSLDNNCNRIDAASCKNYNYISNLNSTWTITASSENTHQAYYINETVEYSNASVERRVLAVVYVAGDIEYSSGTGTEKDPYVIKLEG